MFLNGSNANCCQLSYMQIIYAQDCIKQMKSFTDNLLASVPYFTFPSPFFCNLPSRRENFPYTGSVSRICDSLNCFNFPLNNIGHASVVSNVACKQYTCAAFDCCTFGRKLRRPKRRCFKCSTQWGLSFFGEKCQRGYLFLHKKRLTEDGGNEKLIVFNTCLIRA